MKPYNLSLKNIRKDLNMSQEEVAHALHIQTTTYSKIERGAIQLTLNRLYELAGIFNLTPIEILSYGSLKERASKKRKGNITYIPIHAQAGFLDHYADQSHTEKYSTFSVPIFTEENLFMITVEGDSMYPTITTGTFIIIKEVKDKNFIKWGEPHVIVTTDGRVVKRVLKSHDANAITLYSDNKLYHRYDIPKDHMISLWQIIGKISRSFAPKAFYGEEIASS